jgi:hypothetical protein
MRKKIGISLLIIMLFTSSIFVFPIKQIKATEKTNGDWWNTDWNYRKLITINSSQVESTLSNFPVLINLASDSNLVAYAKADGDDIAFVLDSDNTQLNHEIELYNDITGELYAWVNITSLSSTVDTMIWMYYGNPSCSSQQNPEYVWDSDYVGVWHFSEESGTVYDSTSNDIDVSPTGDLTYLQTGQVGNSLRFGGSNDFLSCSDKNALDLTGEFSVSLWFKPYSISSGVILTKGKQVLYGNQNYQVGTGSAGTKMRVHIGFTNAESDVHNMNINTWYYLSYTFDDSTNDVIFYKDGYVFDTATLSIPMTTNDEIFMIGGGESNGNDWSTAFFDELRLSKTTRSQGWINTSYNMMNSPMTFISVGIEEIYSKIIVSDPYPADGAIDVEIIPTMSIDVNHYSGNQMNIVWKWKKTGTWYVFGTNYNVFNGTYKQINVNFSSYQTTYEWRVEVNDGIGNLVNETYGFTTRPKNYLPVLSNPSPSNGAGVVAGNVALSISVSDRDSDLMDIAFMTNASGSWQTIGTNVSVPNGSYQQNYDFLDYDKTYWWSVNVSDSHGWTNEIYSFKTKKEDSEPPKVNITSPQLGFIYIYFLVVQLRLHILPTTSTLIISKIEIKADITDNKGISWVKFYINDVLRATITEPPYIWDWNELTIYDLYKIKVVACDLSGNQKSDEIEVFKIQLFEIGL